MGVEMRVQQGKDYQDVKTREIQKENVKKLNAVSDMVDNINIDGIESDTQEIKEMITNNLENQTDLDDIYNSINKIAQGISDIKRNQTNLNKKINDIQEKVGE